MAQSQFSPSTSFHSSPLVRLLASLDIAHGADATPTFADALSRWVAWTDAIALSDVLNGDVPRLPADGTPDRAPGARAAMEQCKRVRRDLAQAISRDTLLAGDTALTALPGTASVGAPDGAGESEVDFAACRRHFVAHQRTMDERIASLRADVRAVVAAASPALARLAALDAALDDALIVHQRRVLASVPQLLEKRFKAMRKAASELPFEGTGSKAAAANLSPAAVGRTLQGVLLAELEVRLQPVQGLIDALHNHCTGQA